jgi:predicted phage tail protein
MNWLRSLLREWLGLDDCVTNDEFIAYQETQQMLISALQAQLTEFKQALKARASQVRVAPVYVDYETAQVKALEQFKEKEK